MHETPPVFQLTTNVERVLVPVVVRDRQGRTIDDLRQQDFQVLDNGKPRAISGFAVERRGASTQTKSEPSAANAVGGGTPTATVFLFDDLHLDAGDLARVRTAGMSVISGALTGDDVAAVVSISGAVNTGLARDPAKLQRALEELAPHPLYHPSESDCPSMGYYEADQIANRHDPSAIEDAVRKYNNCMGQSFDPRKMESGRLPPKVQMMLETSARRVLMAGRHDVEMTLATIAGIVQGMSRLPAQRSLVLISPGFLNIEQESRFDESRIIELAAGANVTVSSLDARGLYSTQFTATRQGPLLSGNSLQVNSELQHDATNLSEDVMADLADGTGGVFFHNSNDLQVGLRRLVERPETIYMLQLSVGEVRHDGSLHQLEVKVRRNDVRIAARRAYILPRPEKNAR